MKQQTVSPGIFHIHLDTQTVSTELHETFQKELGFFPHHFTGHPDGYLHFEPTSHSSIKLTSGREFKQVYDHCINLVREFPETVGYLEGEFIPTDIIIPDSKMKKFFRPHFKINRRQLKTSLGETFRETEFHLVMDYERSDQKLIKALLDAGLYGALLDKASGKVIVLTIQGHKQFIRSLMTEVIWYLKEVGGISDCTIKEEIAIRNTLFKMNVENLPEIIDSVCYSKTW